MSYDYACTPGYTGGNASGTWAWKYYGGGYAQTPNGYHNCTLYVAWRLAQNGLKDPGLWGNAADWAARVGGGNKTPAIGSVAWWGKSRGGGFGHVAYVDQISGGSVRVIADNWTSNRGYTSAEWIPISSVEAFLHPKDVGPAPTPPVAPGAGVPRGALDRVEPRSGAVEVAGWAADPDYGQPIEVHIYAGDGAGKPGVNPSVATVANTSRPDVHDAIPGFGPNHGYNVVLPIDKPGVHTVCAYAINAGGTLGTNAQLGCKTVTVPDRNAGVPRGALDRVEPRSGAVEIAGWAADPDYGQPIEVHIYAGDGAGKPGVNPSIATIANTSRPDVHDAIPGFGPNHGYNVVLPIDKPGAHTVCAYAINAGGTLGANAQLGCKTVTVVPKPTVPAGRPASLTISDACVRTGPCDVTWKQPDLGGGELAHYEIKGARNGRDLPVLRVPGTSAHYSGAAFGSCGATVLVVKAVTKRPGSSDLIPGASAQANTVETGCSPPRASIVGAKFTEQGDTVTLAVTLKEPTNGTGTCLIRVNTVAKWSGACGQSQAGRSGRTRTVAIPITDRAAAYSVTVTATNAEGSDTSVATTVKRVEAPRKPRMPQPTVGTATPEPGKTSKNERTSNDSNDSTPSTKPSDSDQEFETS